MAGELKHGPLALIDKAMPVIMIATRDPVYKVKYCVGDTLKNITLLLNIVIGYAQKDVLFLDILTSFSTYASRYISEMYERLTTS